MSASWDTFKGLEVRRINKTSQSVRVTRYVQKVKVKWSRYRPGVAKRLGRGIALLFHDRGNRRGWVVSSTPRPHFTPGKDPVPILHEAGWAPGPVWTGRKSRPHRYSIPDRPQPDILETNNVEHCVVNRDLPSTILWQFLNLNIGASFEATLFVLKIAGWRVNYNHL